MQHRNVVAVTGSIGSGKSAVGTILESLGASVIDADVLARRALEVGSPGLGRVVAEFGPEYLNPDGSLDRKKLGQLVFSEPEKLSVLNGIVHPEVQRMFGQFVHAEQALDSPEPIVYLVPLLFEAGLSLDRFNVIVVVSCTEEVTIDRVMARDNCSRQDVLKRLSAQLPDEVKREKADFVIFNNSDLIELKRQVEKVYPLLRTA